MRVCLHAAYATAGVGPLSLRMATGPYRTRLFIVVKLPLAFLTIHPNVHENARES